MIYQIDNATLSHLNEWCERNVREEDCEDVRNRILSYLEDCDTVDAEYSLSHGWQHIADLTR